MCIVSVWIVTYNHEKFIAEAIESVLNQKTNFNYKIIIGEDCSTDRTREILLDYKEKYPDIIDLYLPEKNAGVMELIRATYAMCKGKYIASFDGDDYWTDPCKLQKQVDFFEANPDFVLHFHRIKIINEVRDFETLSGENFSRNSDNSLDTDHFLEGTNPIYSASVMNRNVIGETLPDWYYKMPYPDYSYYFLLLQYGKVQYSSEVMSVYRAHIGGAWSGDSFKKRYRNMIDFYSQIHIHLPYLNTRKIRKSQAMYHYLLLIIFLKEGDVSGIKKHFKAMTSLDPATLFKNWKPIVSVFYSKYILNKIFEDE